jgi:hypothetical protein
MDAVTLDGIEDFRLPAWIPPRGDFDTVLLHRLDFGIGKSSGESSGDRVLGGSGDRQIVKAVLAIS